jgi:hypothetical protein
MFALADSAEEARGLLVERCNYIPAEDLEKEPDVYDPATEKVGLHVWGGG